MNSSMALSHNPDLCNNCDCLVTLEKFYNDIVLAVAVADGDDTLPRKKKHGLSKPYQSMDKTKRVDFADHRYDA